MKMSQKSIVFVNENVLKTEVINLTSYIVFVNKNKCLIIPSEDGGEKQKWLI